MAEAQAKAAQDALKKVVNSSAFQCLMVLLQFILADSLLRSSIITFLETCKAEIAIEKALLELTVAQLKIALALVETELSALSVVFSVADGLGNRFPLGVFTRCPITATIAAKVQGGNSATTAKNAVGGIRNKIQQAKTLVRDLQYKVARMQKMIDQVNADIESCTLLTAQITAIEDFINALADFPGTITLPLT